MNLINEQDSRLASVFETISCGGKNASHFSYVGFHAAEAFELAARLPGNDLCERGFAGTRRSVKNQGLNAICLDGPPQQLARAKNMRLPDEFIKIPRAHASRQRLVTGTRGFVGQSHILGPRLEEYTSELK